MKEKIKKISQKIKSTATSSPCKYIIGFIVIFFIVLIGAYSLVIDFEDTITEKNINYTEITVVDKFDNDDHLIIFGDDNNTYETKDLNDFKQIHVGRHYHLIVQYPLNNGTIHIIQVYNETGGRQI